MYIYLVQFIVFIFYFILCCSLIYFYKWNKNTGLTIYTIMMLFGFKIAAGSINLFLYNNYFPNSDVSFFYYQSLNELKILHTNPSIFFNDWLFNWGDISGRVNFLKKENVPYWSNLGSLFHSKYMTLSNILTFGQFYANVIIYNIVFFIGQLLLYKTFYKLEPQKKWLFVIGIFLIPSVLFWCSGIHKDGWILTSIGILVYSTLHFLSTKNLKFLIAIILSLFALFVIRYFYFLCLIPPYILWILSRNHINKLKIYLYTYPILLLGFFTSKYISPSLDFMQMVANKQHDFLSLNAFSDLHNPILENNFLSFLHNLPMAIYHILLTPTFNSNNPTRYNIAAIETVLVLILIITCSIFIKKNTLKVGLYLFLLFFSVSVFLFIGYTIPNSGALVRYKSEFTALLIPTLLAISEVPFFKRLYSNKN